MIAQYLYSNLDTSAYENINSLNGKLNKQNLYKVFDHIAWWSAEKGITLSQAGIEQDD